MCFQKAKAMLLGRKRRLCPSFYLSRVACLLILYTIYYLVRDEISIIFVAIRLLRDLSMLDALSPSDEMSVFIKEFHMVLVHPR